MDRGQAGLTSYDPCRASLGGCAWISLGSRVQKEERPAQGLIGLLASPAQLDALTNAMGRSTNLAANLPCRKRFGVDIGIRLALTKRRHQLFELPGGDALVLRADHVFGAR